MQDRGTVVASDPDPQRLRRVVANVERLGLSCVQVRLLDDTARGPARQAPFDAVLVDAPCSNSGVIARRPEARLGLAPRKLRSLIDAQLGLLRQALELVRPGGRVVYSTCSIEPEENDRLVRRTLAAAPGWQIEQEQTTLPAWGPRLADWRDGGYWARVRHGG
jgi:16S rRNA (cytosine967-C5)-methyltransferase